MAHRAIVGKICPDANFEGVDGAPGCTLRSLGDGKRTIVLEWYGHHWSTCVPGVEKMEALARKHGDAVLVCLVNVVAGGAEEAEFCAARGVRSARRFVCIDPVPEYGVVHIPHCTVIHRAGMVVRNGKLGGPDVPDLEPLLEAMVAEPPDADP